MHRYMQGANLLDEWMTDWLTEWVSEVKWSEGAEEPRSKNYAECPQTSFLPSFRHVADVFGGHQEARH